jgi:hypothetical protein
MLACVVVDELDCGIHVPLKDFDLGLPEAYEGSRTMKRSRKGGLAHDARNLPLEVFNSFDGSGVQISADIGDFVDHCVDLKLYGTADSPAL